MKKTAYIWKKICSVCLSAVLVFQAAVYGSLKAVGEGDSNTAGTPSLGFQNEKYEGIQISKNVYSHAEYVKGAGNREPLRESDPMSDGEYAVNELKYDEFKMALYGSKQRQALFHISTCEPLKHVPYHRRRDNSLLYYNIPNNKTVNGKSYALILAPYDIDNYFLYYSKGNGTIEIMYESKNSYYASDELKNSTDPDKQALYDSYMSKNYYEKFLMDGPLYDNSENAQERECFQNYEQATSKFYTGSENGDFFIFDGDVTYFEKEVFTTNINYVRVREQWESIKELDEERRKRGNSNYTGEYYYMVGDDVVSDVASALQGNVLEVANRFDKPTHELEVSKTVSYFGLAQSDVNPFRTTDLFEYKILINDEVPSSIQYKVYDTKTNETKPEAPLPGDPLPDNVIVEGESYRYVTTNGIFHLYAEQTAVFYGLHNGDKVEIREYTNPDTYSVLSNLAEGETFNYVKAANSSETPKRDYASITVTYGEDQNQRRNPTFLNVPNVLQVRKQLDGLQKDSEQSFGFTIKKLLPDPTDPTKPYQYDGEYIVNSEFVTDNNGDPIVIKDANNNPETDSSGHLHYQTQPVQVSFSYYLRTGDNNYELLQHNAEDGVFSLKDTQTAMFVNLQQDTMYLVAESNISSYQLQGRNPRVLRTRKETVDDSHIRSRSAREYELFVNEKSEMKGIILTKIVRDSDNRLNKKAEFTFRIEKSENNQYVPVRNTEYYYKDGTEGYETAKTDQNGYFRVKYNRDHFIVRFPQASGKYRITEVDPNDFDDQNNAIGENAPNPDWEDHLYITDVTHKEYIINADQTTTTDIEQSAVYNENKDDPTRNIVIENINCHITRAAEVTFTNRLREKKYFFDIEKLAYVDDNIHKGEVDSAQRFCFRIERFDTMAQALAGSNPQETFYTDLSCNEKINITNTGTESQPVYQCTNSGGENYPYNFYPINMAYSALTASAEYRDNTVNRTYQKKNTAAVYGQGGTESYCFPTTVYRGYRQIAVKKQGFYKISEVTNWSNTDYDYCTGSNRYKGYLDKTYETEMWGVPAVSKYDLVKNKLFADYETTHETGYDTSNGVLEYGVIIYAGVSENKSSLNTLGCESFDQKTGSVFFNCVSSDEQYIQKRDENGSLQYYVSGNTGSITTEKYNTDGTVRQQVAAPLSEFRIHQTTVVGNTETKLYYDNAQAEPVYELAVTPQGSDLDKFELTGENTPNPYPVYNENGELVTGITAYRLKPSYSNDETLYTHTSQVWRSETVTTYSDANVLRPMASFSNVESEYAILSDSAWADNILKRA